MVPARRSAALQLAMENLVFEATMDGGHSDPYGRPDFAAAMREALAMIMAAPPHASER